MSRVVNPRKVYDQEDISSMIYESVKSDLSDRVSPMIVDCIISSYYQNVKNVLKKGDIISTPIGTLSVKKRGVSKTLASNAKPTVVGELNLSSEFKSQMRSVIDEESPDYDQELTDRLSR